MFDGDDKGVNKKRTEKKTKTSKKKSRACGPTLLIFLVLESRLLYMCMSATSQQKKIFFSP